MPDDRTECSCSRLQIWQYFADDRDTDGWFACEVASHSRHDAFVWGFLSREYS